MWVSVIIPCYNVEAYVAEALDSVLAQDYPWLEVIAVDNNSTDGTLAILQTYEAQFPDKIRVLQEKKQGAPAARNTGWRAAKGEWIQFLDADDLLLPGKIRRQMGMVEEEIELIVGTPIYQNIKGIRHTFVPSANPWMGLLDGLRAGNTCANLWNRKALIDLDGWDESLPSAQDPDLFFRFLCLNRNLKNDNSPCVIWRERPYGQITYADYGGRMRLLTIIHSKAVSHIKQNDPVMYEHKHKEIDGYSYQRLRYYATYNLEDSAKFFKEIMPKKTNVWKLKTDNPIPFWNKLLFSFIGFYYTEAIRKTISYILRKIVPPNFFAK